jgi:broad specificity phosphatase PhoE
MGGRSEQAPAARAHRAKLQEVPHGGGTLDDARHEIVLVRHGETDWSRTGQHTGRTDRELTDFGRRQAQILAPRLRHRSFALVLTSPLRRARDTARLAGFPDAETTDDLLEWDYGGYEGLTTPDIRAGKSGWSLWRDGVPAGESAEQIGERVDRVLARADAAPGDTLLFAHGHVLRVLAARRLGLSPAEGRLFKLDPATVSVLGHDHEWPAIVLWNDRSHLSP